MSIDHHVQDLSNAASGLVLLFAFIVLFWVVAGSAVLIWLFNQ